MAPRVSAQDTRTLAEQVEQLAKQAKENNKQLDFLLGNREESCDNDKEQGKTGINPVFVVEDVYGVVYGIWMSKQDAIYFGNDLGHKYDIKEFSVKGNIRSGDELFIVYDECKDLRVARNKAEAKKMRGGAYSKFEVF